MMRISTMLKLHPMFHKRAFFMPQTQSLFSYRFQVLQAKNDNKVT